MSRGRRISPGRVRMTGQVRGAGAREAVALANLGKNFWS